MSIFEASVDRLSLKRVHDHANEGLLQRTPVSDKNIDNRERIVHKVTSSDPEISNRIIRRAVIFVALDIDLVIRGKHLSDVVGLASVVECAIGVDWHERSP